MVKSGNSCEDMLAVEEGVERKRGAGLDDRFSVRGKTEGKELRGGVV